MFLLDASIWQGMPYGRIEKVSEETISLVSFSEPSQITLETIQLSDIKYVSRDTSIPSVRQKLEFWAKFQF